LQYNSLRIGRAGCVAKLFSRALLNGERKASALRLHRLLKKRSAAKTSRFVLRSFGVSEEIVCRVEHIKFPSLSFFGILCSAIFAIMNLR
jgi:hypothetical protein